MFNTYLIQANCTSFGGFYYQAGAIHQPDGMDGMRSCHHSISSAVSRKTHCQHPPPALVSRDAWKRWE